MFQEISRDYSRDYSRNSKEARVAGAEGVRRRVGDKVREAAGEARQMG